MLNNIPPAPREVIARTLLDRVIPALVTAIEDSADDLAVDTYGLSASVFDVERCANDLLHALADLLVLAPAPMRGVRDLLRFHQLQQPEYSAAYYKVKPSVCPPNPPAAPVSLRPLADIKRDVDQRRNGSGRPPITFVQIDPADEERRIAAERAALAQQRKQDEKIDRQLRRESRADAREQADLKPPADKQKCARKGCNHTFTPTRANHKYCSQKCAHNEQSRLSRQRKKQAQNQQTAS